MEKLGCEENVPVRGKLGFLTEPNVSYAMWVLTFLGDSVISSDSQEPSIIKVGVTVAEYNLP